MPEITIKRGDTLILNGTYTTPTGVVNLTGFTLQFDLYDETDKKIFSIVSNNPTSNRSLIITDAILGKFTLSMFDTNTLPGNSYWADIKSVSASGVVKSSKAIKIKMKNKLV